VKRENEAYYTPPWCVRLLLDYWTPPAGDLWVEPAIGSGNIVRAMDEKYPGQAWHGCDINPLGYATSGKRVGLLTETRDFLAPVPSDYSNPLISLVMTNPPFSLAGRFLIQSRALYPLAYIMFLLRLGFLSSKERAVLWPKYGEPDLFVLPNRPSCTDDGKTDRYDYAWYGFPAKARRCGTLVHMAHVDLIERQRGFDA